MMEDWLKSKSRKEWKINSQRSRTQTRRESYQKIKKGKGFKWEVNSVSELDLAIKRQFLI